MTLNNQKPQVNQKFTFLDLKIQVRRWGAELLEKHHGKKVSLEYLRECEQEDPILGDNWQMNDFKSKLGEKYTLLPKKN